jgi:formylglycine-generating enzyme required for sulfatase activity
MSRGILVHVMLLSACRSDGPVWVEMIQIPAGPFVAGCDPTQIVAPDSCAGDLPRRVAYIRDSFAIDRTEVTNAAYARCCVAGPCVEAARRRGDLGCGGNYWDYPSQPISDISADEARTYCAWAGKRLPTEVEWEKAARGMDGRPYPWGWSAPTPMLMVHPDYDGNYERPVGSRPAGASPYGVLDMAGNVNEWTEPAVPTQMAIVMGNVDVAMTKSDVETILEGPARPTRQILGHRTIIEDPFVARAKLGFRCAN